MKLLEIIHTGGWLMWPILLCSVVALAIVLERLWALRTTRVIGVEVVPRLRQLANHEVIDSIQMREMRAASPLGAVLLAGLTQRKRGIDAVKAAIENEGRQVVSSMERYLNTLGTIAAISPYLGLLGSVLGMIKVFGAFSAAQGANDPALLARGISEILFATAAGLTVAIPSLMFHRYFHGRVNELALRLENEALKFVDSLDRGDSPQSASKQ